VAQGGGTGRGRVDFEFWILDVGWKRKNRRDFRCWMEEEEQARDAPATGGREILNFGF
jgi:hypothetical protein